MTKIEWTHHPAIAKGETWNPWWGCTKIAPECDHCYAAWTATRGLHVEHRGVAKKGQWAGLITRASASVRRSPFNWRRPALVFTCSMSDFWHEKVPLPWLDEALDVIEATPHLTYLALTKRPANINRKLAALNRRLPVNIWAGATIGHPRSLALLKPLRRVKATLRFLSVEPLLAPMIPGLDLDGIGWVIGGGESQQPGMPPRRCDPDWMRAVRDLCLDRDVPFFLKQWGTWANNPTPRELELDPPPKGAKGGATLDGRLWREFPPVFGIQSEPRRDTIATNGGS